MHEAVTQVTGNPLAFLLALLLLLLLEIPISAVMTEIRNAYSIPAPRAADPAVWTQIADIQGPGGKWVGRVERLVFLFSILSSPAITAAWFAFKVASKWEVWTNVYKIPDSIPRVNNLEYLRARLAIGSRTYQRFLVGTGANLLAAFLAAGLFYTLPCLALCP